MHSIKFETLKKFDCFIIKTATQLAYVITNVFVFFYNYKYNQQKHINKIHYKSSEPSMDINHPDGVHAVDVQ